MDVGQSGERSVNLLRGRPLEGRASEGCEAPPASVYELLAELSSHLEWGGHRRSELSRLLSMDAAAGPASVGTEFSSSGEDAMCRMSDRSVVTEATPSRAFEFVTESACEFKRSGKRVGWTIVHRYEIESELTGCRLTYTHRATRATALPGPLAMFRVPVLRRLAIRMSMAELRGGMRNLLRMAEERAEAAGEPATRGRSRS